MSENRKSIRYRNGLGLREEVEPQLQAHYKSALVDYIRASGYRLVIGDLSIHLAKEFGFCYGVDRAVEYAYETRRRFPERRVWLIGEIIHNPHVNERMLEMGIKFLFGRYADGDGYDVVSRDDVVILPAFGLPIEDMERLRKIGCDLVDTTCGSVIVVWKNVGRYARDDFTSIIHGKFYHEETMATASRATENGGHYLILRDMKETQLVCDYIRGRGIERESFLEHFEMAISPGFDPDVHLERLGLANQTTMLMSESLQVAEALRRAMVDRYGEEVTRESFRNFETICSATHRGILPGNVIHHKPVGAKEPVSETGWLRPGRLRLGITAGASTPNNEIGAVIMRILETLDLQPPKEAVAGQ
jgi:4-hydroxy-3-methylbut-2-enyl diphosphate reductase